ncbi:MAG: hypothetical protein HQL89_18775 [Magnetococcales bacterium]|nr:hypothetical protein [Magnetococcales bacterium]
MLPIPSAIGAAKKVIEIGLPVVKGAARIGFRFLQGGVHAVVNDGEPTESSPDAKREQALMSLKISQRLEAIENGLSVQACFSKNQFWALREEIKEQLNVLKGQNEVNFLSQSIQYFINSHQGRAGVDRSVSYALQYDINSVIDHIKRESDVRLPGYLIHQCASLAATVKDMNIFYSTVLRNGRVKFVDYSDVKGELDQCVGTDGRRKKFSGYIPFEHKLRYVREKEDSVEARSSSSFPLTTISDRMNAFWKGNSSKESERKNDSWEFVAELAKSSNPNNEVLYILREELMDNEELEMEIAGMIETMPERRILIESDA